jgi:hypothetical protein
MGLFATLSIDTQKTVLRAIMASVCMQSVAIFYWYAECYYAESRYAECHYAECRGALVGSHKSAHGFWKTSAISYKTFSMIS